jgi:hypothetical protein
MRNINPPFLDNSKLVELKIPPATTHNEEV